MVNFVKELYERFHTDKAVLNYLCEEDNLMQEEEKLLEQLLMEEDAEAGYFEDD